MVRLAECRPEREEKMGNALRTLGGVLLRFLSPFGILVILLLCCGGFTLLTVGGSPLGGLLGLPKMPQFPRLPFVPTPTPNIFERAGKGVESLFDKIPGRVCDQNGENCSDLPWADLAQKPSPTPAPWFKAPWDPTATPVPAKAPTQTPGPKPTATPLPSATPLPPKLATGTLNAKLAIAIEGCTWPYECGGSGTFTVKSVEVYQGKVALVADINFVGFGKNYLWTQGGKGTMAAPILLKVNGSEFPAQTGQENIQLPEKAQLTGIRMWFVGSLDPRTLANGASVILQAPWLKDGQGIIK